MEQKSQQLYTCPMHPEAVRGTPGICPECGMNLAPVKNHTKHKYQEHNKHAGHRTEMFLRKFFVSLILTVPVVLYSDIVQKLLWFHPPALEVGGWKLEILIPLALGSVIFFYGGWVFIVGAWRELKAGLPGMMTLIGIAITAAYFYSVYATFTAPEHTLFWELTTLITIMLLGHWLEMRAVSGAQGALKELSKLLPDTAEIIRNEKTEVIPLSELREGDIVLVRPGDRIPSDGIVIEGTSEVNEAMVTGESAPVAKAIQSEVIAGTINGDGSLKVKVTKIGEHTFLAGVMRVVEEAQASKSRLQILSDRAAFYLTVIAISAGALTFILWLFAKAGFDVALERLVAVLVIACPHALGLAVPLVASISTTRAARHGFLVKQRLALEAARSIDVVLFDKTGTLTRGAYAPTDILAIREIPNSELQITHKSSLSNLQIQKENEVLRLAASVDSRSEHFIAKAIVAEARRRNLALAEVSNFERIAGKGVRGTVRGITVLAGGEAILDEIQNYKLHIANYEDTLKKWAAQGKTIIYVIADKKIVGVIALADLIREESRDAILALKTMGIKIAMITGDSEEVASWVAQELGIDEYFARVLPHQKSEKVKLLQSKGNKVAMVGDGINDAPALTRADLGVAIGAGTNVAIESAGIILVRNDPRDIVKIIKLSRLTYAKMIQNLFWATGYNVVALPLAAGVLAFKGILLQPALAALLMSLSTLIVALNAVLLKKKAL